MSTRIIKVELPQQSFVSIELPADAVPLKVTADAGRVYMYVFTDTDEPNIQRYFQLAATMEEIDCESQTVNYIDTATYLHGAGDVTVHVLEIERVLH